ncbi:MAG: MFS transporter [Ignavibacteria bacterium]
MSVHKVVISKTVWVLCFVSLFTDIASEMLYPIMPVYLRSIGFSALVIGILEGIAEATAGFSKGYFGNLSDKLNRRAPFVQAGYGLSAVSKPLFALFTFPVWIVFVRAIDRLGKGIRTSSRDAILSHESTIETKARIFGLHRGMDTLGAVIGPIFALLYLNYYPGHYTEMFLIAFFPGLASIALSFFIRDKKYDIVPGKQRTGFFSFLKYWKESARDYRRLVIGLLFFAVLNSSDMFLLLMIKQKGFTDSSVIMSYVFYNAVFAAASYPAGMLADKIGLKKSFIIGLIIFAAVYGCMAFDLSITGIFVLFFFYGIYAAMNESISKAWITNITPKEQTATAVGFFSGFNSIAAMCASFLAGILWSGISPSAPFIVTSIGTLVVIAYFSIFIRYRLQQ